MELIITLVICVGAMVGGIAAVMHLPDKPHYTVPEQHTKGGTSLLGLLLGLGMIGHSAAKGWKDGNTTKR